MSQRDFFSGPPEKVISEGAPLPQQFPRSLLGIRDDSVCADDTMARLWKLSETALGEKFFVGERETN